MRLLVVSCAPVVSSFTLSLACLLSTAITVRDTCSLRRIPSTPPPRRAAECPLVPLCPSRFLLSFTHSRTRWHCSSDHVSVCDFTQTGWRVRLAKKPLHAFDLKKKKEKQTGSSDSCLLFVSLPSPPVNAVLMFIPAGPPNIRLSTSVNSGGTWHPAPVEMTCWMSQLINISLFFFFSPSFSFILFIIFDSVHS